MNSGDLLTRVDPHTLLTRKGLAFCSACAYKLFRKCDNIVTQSKIKGILQRILYIYSKDAISEGKAFTHVWLRQNFTIRNPKIVSGLDCKNMPTVVVIPECTKSVSLEDVTFSGTDQYLAI